MTSSVASSSSPLSTDVPGCALCGSRPAAQVTIRRHVGMLIMQRFFKVQRVLCKTCGTKLVKGWTGRTLWQGWWGYISFFVNFFVIGANLVAWRKLASLSEPHHADVPEHSGNH